MKDEILAVDVDQLVKRTQQAWADELENNSSDENDNTLGLEFCTDLAVLEDTESSLVVFESAAAEYFQNRSFKGMKDSEPTVTDISIHLGQTGIAAKYEQIN
jgi:hypothetical protein